MLLPVYNGATYLGEAIRSILGQTFTDFEFLIIDDGSTDESVAIIQEFHDPRIRLFHNGTNLGLVASLNRGLKLARGEYIARMDADDISLPHRLERQITFMDSATDIGVSGAWMESFGSGLSTVWSSPLRHEEIVCKLLFESALFHPTVIIRRLPFQNLGLFYDPEFPHAEDYELWCRCSYQIRLANIGEVLLRYRLHAQSLGQQQREGMFCSASHVRRRWLIQLALDNSQTDTFHDALSQWKMEASYSFLFKAEFWLLQLVEANASKQVFPEPFFSREVAERWATLCRHATCLGLGIVQYYRRSPLCAYGKLSLYEMTVFLLQALLQREPPGNIACRK